MLWVHPQPVKGQDTLSRLLSCLYLQERHLPRKGLFVTNPVNSWKIVTATAVVVGFLLLILYVGLSRYYNAQELDMLVEGANANGQSYSVTIHNQLTGSYSFNAE